MSKRVSGLKRFLAIATLSSTLASFGGGLVGTQIHHSKSTPSVSSRFVVPTNTGDHVRLKDVMPELVAILQDLGEKRISVTTAMERISSTFSALKLPNRFVEMIRPALDLVSQLGDEKIEEALEAIAGALQKSTEPEPSPAATVPYRVQPSP